MRAGRTSVFCRRERKRPPLARAVIHLDVGLFDAGATDETEAPCERKL